MSTLNVDKVDPSTGTDLELGTSGDTINIPSGVTIANAGTATGFGGISWQSVKTSTVTAVAGEGYPVNTTSGAITVDLPAGSVGNQVAIVDYAGTFDSNACTVAPNGSEKIEGVADDYTMETERQAGVLTYVDATQGWLLTSAAPDPGLTPPAPVINYLVVAGGGPSGAVNATNNPGPGGAGGLRSTVTATGGGGSLETALTVDPATNYTVTVGAGGSGAGNNGADSVFSTITSVGGGAGVDAGDGNDGGSGGGGGTIEGAGGAGTANQGYAGGTGARDSNYPAGGGGGAGAVGESPASAAADGGAGGVGVAVAITGSSVYYAGGGGGGAKANPGAGGNGGGGAGSTGAAGTAGTANTGGGAGAGGATGDNTSSNGGSGIVILRYLNTFTISNPGGGLVYATPADDGDYKVASFTSGTGNVQWN